MATDFYYRKLKVYHHAKQMAIDIYAITKKFPAYEQYGLSSQIQRAAVSVPSNIVEGMGRFSISERLHFVEIAYGSLMEVMCQLEIAEHLGYIDEQSLQSMESSIDELSKMLFTLRKVIKEKKDTEK